MTENVQNLNTITEPEPADMSHAPIPTHSVGTYTGTSAKPGTAPTLTKGTAPKAAPTAGSIKSIADKPASKASPLPPLGTAEEVPTITIKLGKNSTVVELNDLMLSVPSVRLQRAFMEAHKAVHRGRFQKTRQQAKTQS